MKNSQDFKIDEYAKCGTDNQCQLSKDILESYGVQVEVTKNSQSKVPTDLWPYMDTSDCKSSDFGQKSARGCNKQDESGWEKLDHEDKEFDPAEFYSEASNKCNVEQKNTKLIRLGRGMVGDSESYPPSKNSSYIEILPPKAPEDVTVIKHSIKVPRTVAYEHLYEFEKKNLRRFCRQNFEYRSCCFHFLGCQGYDDKLNEKTTIEASIFQLVEILKKKCNSESSGLFLHHGNNADISGYLDQIRSGFITDFEKFDTITLGSILKVYMAKYLHGLLPYYAAGPLLKAYDKNNTKKVKKMLYFLPFIFFDDTRRLLMEIFGMLRQITRKEKNNFNSLANILHSLLPSFFPASLLENEIAVENALSIMYMMFFLNYERVPIEFLNK